MGDDIPSVNHYDAVLADLRAQREKIDQAIEILTGLRGGGVGSASGSNDAPAIAQEVQHSMFLGMSIPDATLKLLASRKRKMTNPEIYEGLKAGGLELSSQDPLNVIGSVLSRRFHSVGDIVRVERGTWGLKSWYPGRNFKTKASGADKLPPDIDQGLNEAVQQFTGEQATTAEIEDL